MLYLELCRITRTQQKVLKTEKHSTSVKPRTTSNQSILLTWQPDYCARSAPSQQFSPIPGSLSSPVVQGTQLSEVTICGVACQTLFAFHIRRIWVSLFDFMRGAQVDDIAVTCYTAFLYSALTPTGRTGDSCLLWGGGTHDMVYLRLLTTATRSNVSMCLSGQVWWRLTYQPFHKWYKSLPSQKL